ncbi:MAG: hypothetical protein ACYC35_19800 [Pirellulales bacterium]
MFRNCARMLVLTVIVLVAGVIGCASDPASKSKSTRDDSPNASGADNSAAHGSCH